MTIIWTCEFCRHKNIDEDDNLEDLRCANCGRVAPSGYRERIYRGVGPDHPDPRDIC